METLVISPELALVDPEVRANGLARIVEEDRHRAAAEEARPLPPASGVAASYPVVEACATSDRNAARQSVLVAAGVYLAFTAVRVLALDALFLVAVGGLMLVLSRLG